MGDRQPDKKGTCVSSGERLDPPQPSHTDLELRHRLLQSGCLKTASLGPHLRLLLLLWLLPLRLQLLHVLHAGHGHVLLCGTMSWSWTLVRPQSYDGGMTCGKRNTLRWMVSFSAWAHTMAKGMCFLLQAFKSESVGHLFWTMTKCLKMTMKLKVYCVPMHLTPCPPYKMVWRCTMRNKMTRRK